jgi:hypothetical protein
MKIITGIFLSSIAVFAAAEPIIPVESSGAVSNHTTSPFFAIGIYEPNNEHGWQKDENGDYYHVRERGEGTVYIEEQSAESVILALGSYEPTDWKIKGPGADNVSQIILFGYHSATISGQNADAVVVDKTYESGNSGYISTFYSWDSSEREVAVNELEEIAGMSLTSYSGVYNAESFHIDTH